MSLHIEATYENGVLKPDHALPLQDGQRVRLTVEDTGGAAQRLRGMIQWKGSQQDLEYLAESDDNSFRAGGA